MKIAALAFALLLIGAFAHADVIPTGSHPVSRCAKIMNMDSYPSIYLIGEIVPVGGQEVQLSFIQQGACLSKGYKFNSFNIYYADKKQIDALGGLDKLNVTRKIHEPTAESEGSLRPDFLVAADPRLHFITSQIEPFGGYAPDSDPKANETLEYRLECLQETDKCMNMAGCVNAQTISCKLTLDSSTGPGGDLPPAPPNDTVQPHTPTPQNPAPTPLEPLQSFWCWLMGLFGQKC